MKESIRSVNNKVIFKETFDSESVTRRIGGVPYNIIYNNGVGIFNGTSSFIDYKYRCECVLSIRIKLKIYNTVDESFLLDFRSASGGAGYIRCINNNLNYTSGTFYVNGTETTSVVSNQDLDIVLSGLSIRSNNFFVGKDWTGIYDFGGEIELIELYDYVLTEEEIYNLYINSTYHELPDKISVQYKEELITSFVNGTTYPYEIFLSSGNTIISAINTVSLGNAIIKSITNVTVRERYMLTFNFILNSGVAPNMLLVTNGEAIDGTVSNVIVPTSGVNVHTLTITNTSSNVDLIIWKNTPVDFSMFDISLKKIVSGTGIEKIIDVASLDGILGDKLNNTLSITNVDVKKIGSNVYSSSFPGISSNKISLGNIDDISGNVTIMSWFKATTYGGNNRGRIFDDGKTLISVYGSSKTLMLGRDGGERPISGTNGNIILNKMCFVAIIFKTDHAADIYLNGTFIENKTDLGILSPGTDFTIGERPLNGRYFQGCIPRIVIYQGVLDSNQINQFYTNTKRYYN